MLARRLDEVLAQTDPFDLAQAAERYVDTLSAPEVRRLIDATRPRLNEYYAEEFSRVQAIEDGDSLRAAFAHALAANLRVIPLFGAPFAEAVLAHAPSERAVGFNDESASSTPRMIAGAVVAASLAVAAVVGGHYVGSTRSQSVSTAAASLQTPESPMPQSARMHQLRPKGASRHYGVPTTVHRVPAYVSPSAPVQPAIHSYAVAAAPSRRPSSKKGGRTTHPASLPVAHGEAVVAVPVATRHPNVDSSQPETLDTSDMPQPYTDATPLPDETPVPATDVPRVTHVANPTPAPRRGTWLHRTLMHLDPFKPHPESTP